MNLNSSRLINVLPVGGWENVLTLHKELLQNNTLGLGAKVVSILDGDAKDQVPKKYRMLHKLFLPVQSIEKYLYSVLIEDPIRNVKKEINDTFFSVESIDEILTSFCTGNSRNDKNGKNLYKKIIDNLEKRNISEESFVEELSNIIMKNHNFESFEEGLLKIFDT